MRRIPTLCLLMLCLAACLPIKFSITTFPVEGQASRTITPNATFTPIPSFTPAPISNKTPEPAGSIVLDFASQLCNASWSNGAQALQTCPDASADRSGGYAILLDPTAEGLPAATPVLLTIPGWKGPSALFLRYPAMTVRANDRFRVVAIHSLRCAILPRILRFRRQLSRFFSDVGLQNR